MTMTEESTFEEDYDPIEELPEAVARLRELRAQRDDITAEMIFCEQWIDNHVKDSTIVEIDGVQLKTTPVRGKTTTVNTEKMTRLVPEVAKRVIELVPKVNNDLLVKEIEQGNIPVDLMGQFITQKDKKTSIRVTEYTPHDDEEESTDE